MVNFVIESMWEYRKEILKMIIFFCKNLSLIVKFFVGKTIISFQLVFFIMKKPFISSSNSLLNLKKTVSCPN